MNMLKKLEELTQLSKSVGSLQEYTQGGGGNTYVKINGEIMAVKASGSRLDSMSPESGFVALRYKNLIDFHETVPKNQSPHSPPPFLLVQTGE